jgi:putative transposase
MPRQPRLDVPGIMVRGINKTNIFNDDQDKTRFLERLELNVTQGQCSVYAWVLMNNHVHILFKSGKDGISSVMRKLLTWYAQYYNRRHRRTGHLFENRYKSILCDEDNYLLALVRYIHLNPIRANIIATVEQLDCYPWSGHRVVIGKTKYAWMDTKSILSQFGGTKKKAISKYRRFVREGIGEGKSRELTGGGLIRSQGGWSQVLSMRGKGRKEEFDERILGDGSFVQTILKEAEEKQLRQIKLKRQGRTIADIIREESRKGNISLKQGNRRNAVSKTRLNIARRSRTELGLSGAEIARHLGVNTSSINRALSQEELAF